MGNTKKDTYTKFSNFIFEDDHLDGHDQAVYIVVKSLCYHVATSDNFFKCVLPIKTIANRAKFSETRVKKSFQKLTERGFLYRIPGNSRRSHKTVIVINPEQYRQDVAQHGEKYARRQNAACWKKIIEKKIQGARKYQGYLSHSRSVRARFRSPNPEFPEGPGGEKEELQGAVPSVTRRPTAGRETTNSRSRGDHLPVARRPTLINHVFSTKKIKPGIKKPGSDGGPSEFFFSDNFSKNPKPQKSSQELPPSIASLVKKGIKPMPKVGQSKKEKEARLMLLQKQREEILEEIEKSENGSGK